MSVSDVRQTWCDHMTQNAAAGRPSERLRRLTLIRYLVEDVEKHFGKKDSLREVVLCGVVAELCAMLHAEWRVSDGKTDEIN
jgi:hypothetical protein